MPFTQFDLAPPATTVDGLAAVPIDIQHIDAILRFDGAAAATAGDARVDFVVGPSGGCPIFDLRQTITAAWLDGIPLAIADIAHHDFGGGPGAALRVVETPLAAGSAHSLRVTYTLGTPQASTAGSYQPAIAWSPGPRLRLSFGFTDLGPGRYLESWIPANLIFDQFSLDLELEILNSTIAHVPITNGSAVALGANHWSVAFPDRFTACSHLLELRAADTVTSQAATTTLPGTGPVTIEAWKPVSSNIDLATQLTNLSSWLVSNVASAGPYAHGSRFVAFMNVGGMEYDGGTTSSAGALRHEAFHSWWGRGLKPASQTDAWWDEAWTVYNDLGGVQSAPFDFTEPAVVLSARNPWVRVTPSASYTSGERFFEGVAAMIGVGALSAHMKSFYALQRSRPATTPQLEAFLVARSGSARLVDAFHRFVYGLADPAPVPDLWIKDDPGDPGSDTWAGRFWNSPDLWIRNADDDGTVHQAVEYGQDNWFHARVRNRSAAATARHFLVTFSLQAFVGTEFVYPGDFLPCVAAVAGFDVGPGDSAIVKARWPAALVPAPGMHVCWLASVISRGEHSPNGAHVWEHNNLAQKNLIVADAVPGDWVVFPIVVDRLRLARSPMIALEVVRPRGWSNMEAALLHHERSVLGEAGTRPAATLMGRGEPTLGSARRPAARREAPAIEATRRTFDDALAQRFRSGRRARVLVRRGGKGQIVLGMALHAPDDAHPGEVLHVDLVQRDERSGRVTGGVAVDLRIAKGRTR